LTLEELFAGRFVDIDAMMARLHRTAAELGLPLGDRRHTYNSRLAQELGCWAQEQGKGNRFHHAAFKAYFVDGKNIAKRPVLMEMAEAAGLSPDEAMTVIDKGIYRGAVDRDWALARQRAIAGVPAFIIGRDILVGAQPYSVLVRLVQDHGGRRRRE
jgi:predicted DsbA family dithiol-disulfide isomerase